MIKRLGTRRLLDNERLAKTGTAVLSSESVIDRQDLSCCKRSEMSQRIEVCALFCLSFAGAYPSKNWSRESMHRLREISWGLIVLLTEHTCASLGNPQGHVLHNFVTGSRADAPKLNVVYSTVSLL